MHIFVHTHVDVGAVVCGVGVMAHAEHISVAAAGVSHVDVPQRVFAQLGTLLDGFVVVVHQVVQLIVQVVIESATLAVTVGILVERGCIGDLLVGIHLGGDGLL